MYPCYFTFYTDADSVSASNPGFNIRLFNRGTEGDTYIVRISDDKGQLVKQLTTDTILAGRSATISADQVNSVQSGGRLEISIQSVTNPDFERKRFITITR